MSSITAIFRFPALVCSAQQSFFSIVPLPLSCHLVGRKVNRPDRRDQRRTGNGAGPVAIARGIGLATGTGVEIMQASDFLNFHGRASVVVAPVDIVAPFGESEFLRKIAAVGATAVLVSE